MEENENAVAEPENGKEEETVETPKEDTKPEKPKRSPEEELEYFEGRAKRLRKQLGLEDKKEEKKEEKPKETKPVKSDEVDYSKLAYLEAKGIPEEDHDWLLEQAGDTGKPLKELLSKQWIQEELKERKENRTVSEALPKGTKRSSQPIVDSVEYHVSKGTPLDKIEDIQLRRDVLNARLKKEETRNTFTSNPVIGG